MRLLQFLAVGLIAGWILGQIRRGQGYGLIGNLAIGSIGALIGGFLSGFLGVQPDNFLGAIAMAVVGAVVFFVILGFVRSGKRKRSPSEEKE